MAKNFRELEAKMSPEGIARSNEIAQKLLAEIELSELREKRKVTQTQLAGRLKRTQATISQIEGRNDWLVSTLNEYVQALGGELDVRAIFPDKTIRLTHFAKSASTGTARKKARR
ncbi:MAG TPA: helix-turn-helix transcriptional regulator [Candidatus Acidoferrum sp.]|jgi:DNA-binding XRE family transcriptional regulator